MKVKTRDKQKRVYSNINRECVLMSFKISKGGVGKSTLTLKFAREQAQKGKKVVILDFDEQQNITKMLECNEKFKNLSDLLDKKELKNITDKNILELVKITDIKGLRGQISILPGSDTIESDFRYLEDIFNKGKVVGDCYTLIDFFKKYIVNPLNEFYDIILFDLSPGLTSMSILSQLTLHCIDFLVCPIDGEGAIVVIANTLEWLQKETQIREKWPDCLFIMCRYQKDTKALKFKKYNNIESLNTWHAILLKTFPNHTLHTGAQETQKMRGESTKNFTRRDVYTDPCRELMLKIDDKSRRNICDIINENPELLVEFQKNIDEYIRYNKPKIKTLIPQFISFNKIKINILKNYKKGRTVDELSKTNKHLTKKEIENIIDREDR